MIFTEKNKEAVKKFNEIMSKGYYVNSQQLTRVYNEVLEKNVPNTNCSSCCRQRVSELVKALKQWEAKEAKEAEIQAQEASKIAQDEPKQEDLATTKEEKNNAPEAKKRGRPKVKKEE